MATPRRLRHPAAERRDDVALALLDFDAWGPDGARFRFDIGSNRFFRVAVGSEDELRRIQGGERVLEARDAPLQGPLAPSSRGRGRLVVQSSRLGEQSIVQLQSYRTRDGYGPAWSRPVRLRPRRARALPEISLARSEEDMTQLSPTVRRRPYRYREVVYSDAMFLGALMGALPSILPTVGNLLGGLFKGGGSAGGGSTAGRVLSNLGNPQTVETLKQLIQQIMAAAPAASSGAAPAAPAAPAPPAAPATPAAQARALAVGGGLSEAQFAPALLAALPALMPLLKQVANPATLKTLLDAPNRSTQTIINGIKDFAKLGIQSHEQDLKHLRELNPGVDDPALDALLQSLSSGAAPEPRELRYRRVDSVKLSLNEVRTQPLFGQERVLYRRGGPIAFPVALATPRTIPKARLHLRIKDPETLAVLHHARASLRQLASGPLPNPPRLSAQVVAGLEAGKRLLVCIDLVWKNREGRLRGTSVQQLIQLVEDYAFDRTDEAGELIPLNDAARHRAFWHRIWSGRMPEDTRRLELGCSYLYVLRPDETSNARLDTQARIREGRGTLRSGMELSPQVLAQLRELLAPGEPALNEGELSALSSDDFVQRINQRGRARVRFRGRPGDGLALWVYPEVKLQDVVLRRVAESDTTGNVTSLAEHRLRLPIPAQVHFVGVRDR